MDSQTVTRARPAIQHPHDHANPKSELNPRGHTKKAEATANLRLPGEADLLPLFLALYE